MVDDDYFNWCFRGHQLQAELLLECGENGRQTRTSFLCWVGLLLCPVEGEVVGSLEAGLVDDLESINRRPERRVGEVVERDGGGG